MIAASLRPLVPALALALLVAPPALGAAPKAASAKASSTKAASDKTAAATAPAPVAKGRLFAVVIGPGAKWKKGQPFKGPGLEQHRAYWKKLHAEGRVASAGPLGSDIGLILLRAKNQNEANALIRADPAVTAQILHGVARPYSSALTSGEVLAGR